MSIAYEVQSLRLVIELVIEGIFLLPRAVPLTPCQSAALVPPELAGGSVLVGSWSVDGGGYGVCVPGAMWCSAVNLCEMESEPLVVTLTT